MESINAQKIIDRIEQGDATWIYEHFSEAFQEITSFEQLVDLLENYNAIRGINDLYRHLHINLHDEYIWFDRQKTTGVSITLNKYQEIVGMALLPIKNSKKSKVSKQSYTIPIKSSCLVYCGGDNELINYHYRYKQQRHAIDLVQVKEGCTYSGDPNHCENYYSYNKEIVAPANGVVEEIVDGIPDCVPGEQDTVHPEGNYIIIKHGRHEYSMIAHIKPASFKIEQGDTVFRGQHIANVGNSGNTPEPHIHFQVMNDKYSQSTQTLKIKFQNKIAPVKGDIVNYTGNQIFIKEHAIASFIKSLRSDFTHLFKG